MDTRDYEKIKKFGGYCGIAAIVIYVLCTLAAAFQFPVQYNPFDNWISDLGSYEKNPSGALIYDVGAGVAGLLLVPLFISLMAWYKQVKKYRLLYLGAEVFGLIAALGMIMHAIFQEGTSLHTLWATVCFGALVVVLVLANTALLRHPQFNKKIGNYGSPGGARRADLLRAVRRHGETADHHGMGRRLLRVPVGVAVLVQRVEH